MKSKGKLPISVLLLFILNAMIYGQISISIMSRLSFVIDNSGSNWKYLLVDGIAWLFWIVVVIFAIGFYDEERRGKDTRNAMPSEVAIIRLIIQIFFLPARHLADRIIKKPTASAEQ